MCIDVSPLSLHMSLESPTTDWIDAIRSGRESVDCVFESARLTLRVEVNQLYVSKSFASGRDVTYVITRGLVFVYSPAERIGEIEHLDGKTHAGGFFLRLVDALANGLGLIAVRVVDASHIEAKCRVLPVPPIDDDESHMLSLAWFRAMVKGEGWYESHGYRIEDSAERASYDAYVARMRSLGLAEMVDTVARDGHVPEASLSDRAQNQVRDIFVSLGKKFLEGQRAATFPEFLAWAWKSHCEYVAPLEHHLFSFEYGRQENWTMRSWQIDIPGELIKQFNLYLAPCKHAFERHSIGV